MSNKLISETETAIHEIGHMFGAKDHNKAGQTEQKNEIAGSDIYSDNCTYGLNGAGGKYTMCQGCRQEIQANLDKYSLMTQN